MEFPLRQARTSSSSVSTTRSLLERTFTARRLSDQDSAANSSKGPTGLTTLHEPVDDLRAPIADIVFVHGLNGGSQSTWSKRGQPDLFWPKEWLPRDAAFEDTRIHSFGYDAGVSKESILGVHDFARSLLAAVSDAPSMTRHDDKPPLIFVAHSMGGMVVKKAFIIGSQEAEFRSVVDRISSIVFLATPHHGSALAQTLSRLFALTPGSRPFVKDLVPSSVILQAINEEFPRLCSNIQLLSFFETRPMSAGGVKSLIVEKTSAVLNLPNERRTHLDADHRNVAMYASPEDPSYLSVRNALASIMGTHRKSSVAQSTSRPSHEDQSAINRFLGFSSAPDDDLATQHSARLDGSCEWIEDKEYFQTWRNSMDARLLWLHGRPGSGKSVLSGHIIRVLKEADCHSSFFFFQGDDNTKSNINACLRSLVWQMASLHPEVSARLREFVAESSGQPLDQHDANAVWRKVFVGGLLKITLDRPQFWVIDAMDECKRSPEMLDLLCRIQDSWPVSILVTSRDPAASLPRGRANAHTDIRVEALEEQDSKQDITRLLESRLEKLPFPSYSKWSDRREMAEQIIDTAGGSILWASLICSELEEACTESEINNVLSSVPSDMRALYAKALRDMEGARYGKQLTNSILTWATYAFRHLTTSEIQQAIELDIKDRVDDIERSVSKCCSHLVYVDTRKRVRLVHATAREFLTAKDLNSELIADKAEAHRRLGLVCLEYLSQGEPSKPRRGGGAGSAKSPSPSPSQAQPSPFLSYASAFAFQHLNMAHSYEHDVFVALSKFLSSTAVLRWIEHIAGTGNLHPVYQAGKVIQSLLKRRARHSPPFKFAAQKQLAMLDKWGEDLVHIATKFSSQLRVKPDCIHNLIPPFCPQGSAIRQQFANAYRGMSVQGLSEFRWDDCLATVHYSRATRPNVVAAGLGLFAVGLMNGNAVLYDDLVLQEVRTVQHKEPIWKMSLSQDGQLLATAGAARVRVWETQRGQELDSFRISSVCIALAFSSCGSTLWAVTRQNHLYEWDVDSGELCHEEPLTWAAQLEPQYRMRTPTMAALHPETSMLALVYRGEDLVLWDFANEAIHDIYEAKVGSREYGATPKVGGSSTVRALAFSASIDTDRLAATHNEGDLVLYDTREGMATAIESCVNALVLASSPDGRTLAGADSQGNLTLFDFETLTPLYRIYFQNNLVPQSLVFSADSRRILELRGYECRLWEPTVLLRADDTDEGDLSDTVSVSSAPIELSHVEVHTEDPGITALACSDSQSVVVFGKSDGSVHLLDLAAESQTQQVCAQGTGAAINQICLVTESSSSLLVAFGESNGRVLVRKVVNRAKGGRVASWEWDGNPVAEIPSSRDGVLKQLLISPARNRVLVVTRGSITLWSIDTTAEPTEAQILARLAGDETLSAPWASCPSDIKHLWMAADGKIDTYSWDTLEPVHSRTCATTGVPQQARPLGDNILATISSEDTSTQHGHSTARHMQLWDVLSLTADSTSTLAPLLSVNMATSRIVDIVGVYGNHMVVLTADHWIASMELPSRSATPAKTTTSEPSVSLTQHFFFPNDWVSANRTPMLAVSQGGEILLARQFELAVIKRGLVGLRVGAGADGLGAGARRTSGQRLSTLGSSQRPDASRRRT